MTAGTHTPKRTSRAGRIIERPRLIKQLDATEAPVILLVAPAGYGKTTLARQWAKTLSGVIWVSATPSHRDVVTFSEDVARGIDELGGNASRFIGEYMRARSNPQKAAREIANVLAQRLEEVPMQWLIIDDYQELAESPEVEEMVTMLRERIRGRMLVASRVRPKWATTRAVVYAEIDEIGPNDLALDDDETAVIVGRRPDLAPLVAQAQGWPAVLALAARLDRAVSYAAVPGTIHRFVAEELFRHADERIREGLLEVALLPDLRHETVARSLPDDLAQEVMDAGKDLGFVGTEDVPELHPLMRDFLFEKLAADASAVGRVEKAVEVAIELSAWDLALDLVLRFDLQHLIDPVLQQVFKPLVRSGRLGTVGSLLERIRHVPQLPPAAIDVVDAEMALRDGQATLAADLADRARANLPSGHQLLSRAHHVAGRAHFFTMSFAESAAAYDAARKTSMDDADELDSVFGLAATQIYSEEGDPKPALEELTRRRHQSSTHLVRYATTVLNVKRFSGFGAPLPLDEALHALPTVADPQVRTAFTYTAAYILAQRTDYKRAEEFLALFADDVRNYELDFAQPFLDWTSALIDLGLRRFGKVDRSLQRVEDAGARSPENKHSENARMLRARLLLQTGSPLSACELLEVEPESGLYPSWRGELWGTRALASACAEMAAEAHVYATRAEQTSRFVEVRVFASAARAVVASLEGDAMAGRPLFAEAERVSLWDPVVCALRSSRPLLAVVAADQELRPALRALLDRCGDTTTARHAGIRTRATRAPGDLLSPRELEVLGLVAGGMRNREIAAALYVEESTVKVHIRHILEKLGVRTRAEAVARYERTVSDSTP